MPWPCSAHQPHGIIDNIVGYRYATNQMLYFNDLFSIKKCIDGHLIVGGGGFDYLYFLRDGRVFEFDGEHKTVQLGLWQGIGSFLLNRILCSQHKIRLIELVLLSTNGHRPFLHSLQQGGLCFGWRPVDFVREDNIPEHRTHNEFEVAVLVEHLTTQNITGHQIGCKLYPFEIQSQGLRYGIDHQSLRQTGNTYQQGMSSSVYGQEYLFDDRLLAHNDLGDFLF